MAQPRTFASRICTRTSRSRTVFSDLAHPRAEESFKTTKSPSDYDSYNRQDYKLNLRNNRGLPSFYLLGNLPTNGGNARLNKGQKLPGTLNSWLNSWSKWRTSAGTCSNNWRAECLSRTFATAFSSRATWSIRSRVVPGSRLQLCLDGAGRGSRAVSLSFSTSSFSR